MANLNNIKGSFSMDNIFNIRNSKNKKQSNSKNIEKNSSSVNTN